MTFRKMDPKEPLPQPGEHWLALNSDTERSIGGAFFAVEYWLNPDMGGFVEPWDTGLGRYAERQGAIDEAYAIARMKDMPYLLPELAKGEPT